MTNHYSTHYVSICYIFTSHFLVKAPNNRYSSASAMMPLLAKDSLTPKPLVAGSHYIALAQTLQKTLFPTKSLIAACISAAVERCLLSCCLTKDHVIVSQYASHVQPVSQKLISANFKIIMQRLCINLNLYLTAFLTCMKQQCPWWSKPLMLL